MTSVLDSFEQALPSIERFGKPRSRPAHLSGNNTEECEAPAAALEIPLKYWMEKSDDLCLCDKNHRSRLEGEYMPSSDPTQLIRSEEDIVTISTLQFTYPVNIALNLVFPEDKCLCEVFNGKDQIQRPTSRAGRCDKMYFNGLPTDHDQPGRSGNTMACLEYKTVGSIKPQDFSNMIVTTKQAHQGRLEAAEEEDMIDSKDVDTLLKQATHYAIKFKTPFVALFDYHTLILLIMTQADRETGEGGEFTYMTVVSDSKHLRKAFLGFLLCAHLYKIDDETWHVDSNGLDVLTKVSDLADMTDGEGTAPSSSRRNPARSLKKSYKERGSQSSSSS